jgi:hypothetical protein
LLLLLLAAISQWQHGSRSSVAAAVMCRQASHRCNYYLHTPCCAAVAGNAVAAATPWLQQLQHMLLLLLRDAAVLLTSLICHQLSCPACSMRHRASAAADVACMQLLLQARSFAAAVAAAAVAQSSPAQLSSLFFLMTSAYQLALILGMRSSVCARQQHVQCEQKVACVGVAAVQGCCVFGSIRAIHPAWRCPLMSGSREKQALALASQL